MKLSSIGASMNWPLPVVRFRVETGDRGVGGVQAGDLVGHQRGHVVRRAAVADVEEIGDAGAGLDEIVIGGFARIRTIGAIAGAVNVDDVFAVQRLQVFIAEAEALQAVHADVGEEHVGLLHEAAQRLDAFGVLEVEQDGALVAVAAHVDGAHARRGRRAGVAHDVARAVLDLDDVGAHVAHQLRGVGAEHDGGEIQDLDARERAGRRGGHAHSLPGQRCGLLSGGVAGLAQERPPDGHAGLMPQAAQATGFAGFRL